MAIDGSTSFTLLNTKQLKQLRDQDEQSQHRTWLIQPAPLIDHLREK
jgi:hypothetical protein